MITRKSVLEAIRKEVNIDAWQTYSEPNQTHQRVKWFCCNADSGEILKVLNKHGFKGISVEGGSWPTGSITLRFPFELYC